MLANGHANKEVAYQLGCSTDTIKSHLKTLYSKLGVEDRTHAVTVAARRGYIDLARPWTRSPPRSVSEPKRITVSFTAFDALVDWAERPRARIRCLRREPGSSATPADIRGSDTLVPI
ncbi:response regulator transcription factor [Caulobacter segnis]